MWADVLPTYVNFHQDAHRRTKTYFFSLLTTDGPDIKASYVLSHIRENCD